MAQDAGEDVRATELIAAVSLAVDIGMAQPAETGLAVCLVAVELAERLGYEPGLMQRTFRLALLQHGHIQRIYAKTGVVHHEAAGKSVPTGFGDGVRMMRWVVSEQRHSG